MLLRRRLLGFFSLAVLVIALALGAEGQAPRRGGTLRLVEPGEPDSLDMARTLANYSFIVGEQIFEGLFRWTPQGLRPWLARDVQVSPDGKTWTFRLQEGRHLPRRHALRRRGGEVQPGADPGRQGLRLLRASWPPWPRSRPPPPTPSRSR